LLFFPMDSDLRLIDFCLLFLFLYYAGVSHGMDLLDFSIESLKVAQPVGVGP
jgi:hypothetical protein